MSKRNTMKKILRKNQTQETQVTEPILLLQMRVIIFTLIEINHSDKLFLSTKTGNHKLLLFHQTMNQVQTSQGDHLTELSLTKSDNDLFR